MWGGTKCPPGLDRVNTGTFCTKSNLFLSSAVICMVMLLVAGYICTCSLSQNDNLRQENSGFFYHIYRAIPLSFARQSKCLLQDCPQQMSRYTCTWEGLALFPASSFLFSKLEKTSLGTHFFACTFFLQRFVFSWSSLGKWSSLWSNNWTSAFGCQTLGEYVHNWQLSHNL